MISLKFFSSAVTESIELLIENLISTFKYTCSFIFMVLLIINNNVCRSVGLITDISSVKTIFLEAYNLANYLCSCMSSITRYQKIDSRDIIHLKITKHNGVNKTDI